MKTSIKLLPLSIVLATISGCSSTTLLHTEATGAQNADTTRSIIAPQKQTRIANQQTDIALTLQQIMSDPDWLGRQPEAYGFSADNQHVVYARKRQGSVIKDVFIADPSTSGNGRQVAESELHLYDYDEFIDDEDSAYSAWLYKNNIFVRNKSTGKVQQLTRTSHEISNIQFLNDDAISYQHDDRFMSVAINGGMQSELLNWKFAEVHEPVKAPSDYLAEQQLSLIQYHQVQRKNRQDRHDHHQTIAQENNSVVDATVYLPKTQSNVLASISPDGKWAVVVTRDKKEFRSESDIMPDYIEEDGRIKARPVRQRVADAKPESHYIYLINVQEKTHTLLDYKVLPGYNEDVLADEKTENAKAKGETYTVNRLPRDIGLLFDWYATEMPIKWHDNADKVALMLEAWDNKDRWIVTVDVDDKRLKTQHRMHDDAWVNYRFNQFGWFDNSEKLYLLSEQSGYSQLYTKPLDGELQAVTQGKFVVDNVVLSHDDRYFYYKANKKHPGIYEVYQANLETGEHKALTDLNGMTDFILSPQQDRVLLTHSSLTMPPELYSKAVADSAVPLKITDTVSDAFKSIDWVAPSIVPVKSSHTEQPIYSRVYQPTDNTTEKRRAVIFNHGAGYLQNSHLGWSGYFREFMFHSFLVSKGYVVMDMDYRASAGYGRDWRTAIYRQMGTPETQDLKDGVQWLVENANVDRDRIGTYGGSYGGFMTFMALFTEPDLFQAGAALRPVTDWAHYNTAYTSNILNTPNVDPIAYERSSPIYFAEGLSKPLLINAPMVDNNVFFVDVVRLVQRLIELEKENFETAIYPVEPHGFVQPSSWLDEYRRIFKLFEDNL